MRRTIFATVLGLLGIVQGVQADEPVACDPATSNGYGVTAPLPVGDGVPLSREYRDRYVYGGYGLKLRGGYGRNGYAPVCGPVWGPNAFLPAAGKGYDPRPRGAYVRALVPSPEMMVDAEPAVPGENMLPAKEKPIAEGAYRRMTADRR